MCGMNNVPEPSWLQDGAWIATILSGLSIVAGVIVWINKQLNGWRERQRALRHRNWHGYIIMGTISSWYVRAADDPKSPTGRIVLDVLDGPDGTPNANRAHSLRLQIAADGIIARAPTPEEDAFLKSLSRKRGGGNDPEGFPVR